MKSILTRNQKKVFTKKTDKGSIKCTIRYDDQCGNGHNSFSITGDTYDKRGRELSCGCIHEEIEKYFPEFKHLIKWHLMNSNGPMYYIENTTYHAKENGVTHGWIKYSYINEEDIEIAGCEYIPIEKAMELQRRNPQRYTFNPNLKTIKIADLNAARSCAVWPDATIEQFRDKDALLARLPGLIKEFCTDIEKLKFVF